MPDDFYKYLTEISTNCLINVDYCTNNHYAQKIVYPNFYTSDKISKINLKNLPNTSELEVEISKNIVYFDYNFLKTQCCENDLPTKNCTKVSMSDIQKAMFYIGSGHSYLFPYYIYLGKGFHFGSVWANIDDFVYFDNSEYSEYSDDPSYLKVFSSFSKFLERINKIKEDPTPLERIDDYLLNEDDDDLINLFVNYKEYDKFIKDQVIYEKITFINKIISKYVNNLSKNEHIEFGKDLIKKFESNIYYHYKIIINKHEMESMLIEILNSISQYMDNEEKIQHLTLFN